MIKLTYGKLNMMAEGLNKLLKVPIKVSTSVRVARMAVECQREMEVYTAVLGTLREKFGKVVEGKFVFNEGFTDAMATEEGNALMNTEITLNLTPLKVTDLVKADGTEVDIESSVLYTLIDFIEAQDGSTV